MPDISIVKNIGAPAKQDTRRLERKRVELISMLDKYKRQEQGRTKKTTEEGKK